MSILATVFAFMLVIMAFVLGLYLLRQRERQALREHDRRVEQARRDYDALLEMMLDEETEEETAEE